MQGVSCTRIRIVASLLLYFLLTGMHAQVQSIFTYHLRDTDTVLAKQEYFHPDGRKDKVIKPTSEKGKLLFTDWEWFTYSDTLCVRQLATVTGRDTVWRDSERSMYRDGRLVREQRCYGKENRLLVDITYRYEVSGRDCTVIQYYHVHDGTEKEHRKFYADTLLMQHSEWKDGVMTDPGAKFEYDKNNRLVRKTLVDPSKERTSVYEYTYTRKGILQGQTVKRIYDHGLTETYIISFDAYGHPVSEKEVNPSTGDEEEIVRYIYQYDKDRIRVQEEKQRLITIRRVYRYYGERP